MNGREIANNGYGQAGRQKTQGPWQGSAGVAIAHKAGLAHGNKGNKHAVNTLCTGQQLQNKHLTKLAGVFGYHGRKLPWPPIPTALPNQNRAEAKRAPFLLLQKQFPN